MSKIKAIISDADGTLVDTLYLIRHGQYEAAVEYLVSHGLAERSHIPHYEVYEDYINKSVGGPTLDTFHKTLSLLFKDHMSVDHNAIDFVELDKSLQPVQDRLAPLYVHPFHGLTELFEWLGTRQVSMGIFTSGSPHHIVRNFGVSLPVLGYGDLYKDDSSSDLEKIEAFKTRAKAVYGMPNLEIVTCQDVSASKPDPEGILTLLDRLDCRPEEVILLGDHPVDMHAAHAAGIKRAVGITHGFGSPAELHKAGAFQMTHNLTEVIDLIENNKL